MGGVIVLIIIIRRNRRASFSRPYYGTSGRFTYEVAVGDFVETTERPQEMADGRVEGFALYGRPLLVRCGSTLGVRTKEIIPLHGRDWQGGTDDWSYQSRR